MKSVVSHALPILALVAAALWAAPALADFSQWEIDIGYASLADRLGAALPDGSTVRALQVESEFQAVNAYLPSIGSAELSGKTITDLTGTGVYSWHANQVAQYFYGNTLSMTPGISTVGVYMSDDFTSRVLNQNNASAPPIDLSNYDVVNHSWIGQGINSAATNQALARFDYQIAQSHLFVAAGVNNVEYSGGVWSGYSVPAWWGWSRNSMSVGVSSAYSSRGPTSLGTCKPEIMVPVSKTSWATAVVSSAGALLIDGANTRGWTQAHDGRVIKALLMTGATKLGPRQTVQGGSGTTVTAPGWPNSDPGAPDPLSAPNSVHPLDSYQGAGQLNISNSWDILRMGDQGPSSSSLVAHTGYDLQTLTAAGSKQYFFNVPSAASSFTATLAWYEDVTGMVNGTWSGQTSLANLDLRLYYVNDGTFTTSSLLRASLSTVDNVEHIYVTNLPAGRYALSVDGGQAGNTYALAWQSMTPLLPGDANADGQVSVGDLGVLATNYGTTSGAGWVKGDFNGDGDVGVGDLGILAANYGASNAAYGLSAAGAAMPTGGTVGVDGAAVPEPATMALLGLGALAAVRRRRRCR